MLRSEWKSPKPHSLSALKTKYDVLETHSHWSLRLTMKGIAAAWNFRIIDELV